MVVEGCHPEAAQFLDDLPLLTKAKRVDLNSCEQDVKFLSQGVKMLELELKKFQDTKQIEKFSNDMFAEKLTPFLDRSKAKVEQLQSLLDQLPEKTEDVSTYFGADDMELDELLTIFDTFCTDYKETKVALDKQKAAEEKKARQDAAKAIEDEKKRKKKLAKQQKNASSAETSSVAAGTDTKAPDTNEDDTAADAIDSPEKTAPPEKVKDAKTLKREAMMARLAASKKSRQKASSVDNVKNQTQGASAYEVLENTQKRRSSRAIRN
jgi:hypothetical protein